MAGYSRNGFCASRMPPKTARVRPIMPIRVESRMYALAPRIVIKWRFSIGRDGFRIAWVPIMSYAIHFVLRWGFGGAIMSCRRYVLLKLLSSAVTLLWLA